MAKVHDPAPRDVLGGRARALALTIAAEARARWPYATQVIAKAFRQNPQLGSGVRRRLADTVYGLIRWDRRLDLIVDELLARRRGVKVEISPEARDDLKLLVHELREGAPPAAVPVAQRSIARLSLDDAALAACASEDAGLGKLAGLDREAARRSYPTWLLERFVAELGSGAALALADAMNQRAPMTVRCATTRTARTDLAVRLAADGVAARPTSLAPAGLILDSRVNAFGLSAFQEGLFEVMDEGSQLVAEAVAPPPGGRVADACAGAGGKTLALADLLGGRGRVLALDVNGKKLEELRRRARRAGLSNVMARPIEGASLPREAKPSAFDRVLVDAPCSGLGTLRRNPEARWRLTPRAVDAFPTEQLALLVTYAPLVAPGARLVYATCTVLAAENERVVERFLAERPDFRVVPLKEILGRDRARAVGDEIFLRVHPHTHDTDGFFAAVLRRAA